MSKRWLKGGDTAHATAMIDVSPQLTLGARIALSKGQDRIVAAGGEPDWTHRLH
jgi:hypothetical protein